MPKLDTTITVGSTVKTFNSMKLNLGKLNFGLGSAFQKQIKSHSLLTLIGKNILD